MNIILRFSGILLLTILSIGVVGIVVIKADLLSHSDLWITSASGAVVSSVDAPSLPMSDTEFNNILTPLFFERCTGCHGVQHYLRR